MGGGNSKQKEALKGKKEEQRAFGSPAGIICVCWE
jgi:hypothetical protein